MAEQTKRVVGLYLPWASDEDGGVTCSASLDMLRDVGRFDRPEYAAEAARRVNQGPAYDAMLALLTRLENSREGLLYLPDSFMDAVRAALKLAKEE